ncbi:radical SAM protein [Nocardia sp. CA-128927]|uniref:radical SAM protein n=1 Tax=Nocardia sp. CA-128927 TaxID=3239975 RepID=UPI003D95BC69
MFGEGAIRRPRRPLAKQEDGIINAHKGIQMKTSDPFRYAGQVGSHIEPTGRLLRLVIDAVNECNLRCKYCHPGEVWLQRQLPLAEVVQALAAAEQTGILEVVLTGGEITLHDDLQGILEATHQLKRCASTLITNATKITSATRHGLEVSNLTRICTSVDGVTNELHGFARGKNLPKVLEGLRRLRDTGKPITVITVVHQGNWERVVELTEYLADHQLAEQHHLCAPSFSGQAREHYPGLALHENDFHRVQALVDQHHRQLLDRGVYLTFNSFWPATGLSSDVTNPGRMMTLQQLSEQVKDTLCNIRPNGEFRLQASTWGREMVGNAVVGSVHAQRVPDLIETAESLLATGSAGQLPRETEARHKFQLGAEADREATQHLIGRIKGQPPTVDMIPIASVDEHWLMSNHLDAAAVAARLRAEPTEHRITRHPTGKVLVFDRRRSLVTLLGPEEWPMVLGELSIAATGSVMS